MRRIFVIIICVFILASCGFQHFAYLELPNGSKIKARLAITPEEKVTGMSALFGIGEKEGMLFVEREPQAVQFWMKGMKFPLDIIFLDKDKKVIEVHAGMEPCFTVEDCPKIDSATADVKYALEVAAGAAEKWGIALNSTLKW